MLSQERRSIRRGLIMGWDKIGAKTVTSMEKCWAGNRDGVMASWKRTGKGAGAFTLLQEGSEDHMCPGREGAMGDNLTPRMALV